MQTQTTTEPLRIDLIPFEVAASDVPDIERAQHFLRARDDWEAVQSAIVDELLNLGSVLIQGKREHPANVAFGEWRRGLGLELCPQELSAAMRLAEQAQAVREFFETAAGQKAAQANRRADGLWKKFRQSQKPNQAKQNAEAKRIPGRRQITIEVSRRPDYEDIGRQFFSQLFASEPEFEQVRAVIAGILRAKEAQKASASPKPAVTPRDPRKATDGTQRHVDLAAQANERRKRRQAAANDAGKRAA